MVEHGGDRADTDTVGVIRAQPVPAEDDKKLRTSDGRSRSTAPGGGRDDSSAVDKSVSKRGVPSNIASPVGSAEK